MKKKGFVMINRILTLLSLFFLCNSIVLAQTPEEIDAQMDEIKLNESLVYGESFSEDEDIAYQNALSELVNYANELRNDKGKSMLKISDLQTRIKELKYYKNGRHSVLVYLPLSVMLSLESKNQSDVISQLGASTPKIQESISKESSSNNSGLVFVPRQTSGSSVPTTASKLSDDIHEILSSQDNWIEIKGILSEYKHDGFISSTGNVYSLSEVPDDAYSILLDDLGGILAILSPKNSAERINYKTNLRFDESNITDCKFIVWYK